MLSVLIHHWCTRFSYKLPLGDLGVRLFFVISGFLITGILLGARNRVSNGAGGLGGELGAFYARRTLRIFPLYYLVLLVAAGLDLGSVRQTLPWHLAYGSNIYFALRGAWQDCISHLWSLSVEEQFYLVWPLCVLLAPRRLLPPLILAAIAVGPAFRLWALAVANPIAASVLAPGCFDALGFGALLALQGCQRWRALLAAGGAGLAVTLAVGFNHPGADFVVVWQPFAAAAAFAGLLGGVAEFSGRPVLAPLRWAPLLYLGKISYGVYLIHLFVPEALARFGLHTAPLVAPVIYAAITIALAALSWQIFEAPMNRLKRHFPYGRRPAARLQPVGGDR